MPPPAASGDRPAARQKGLIIGKGGLFGNVSRLSPLIIAKDDVDYAIGVVERSSARSSARCETEDGGWRTEEGRLIADR